MPIRIFALGILLTGVALGSVIASAPTAPATGALVPAPAAAPAMKGAAVQRIAAKPLLAAGVAAREAVSVSRFDAAIADARDHALSEDDARRIRDAVAALGAGDAIKAASVQAEIDDPIGRKLIDWNRLRGGGGTAEEYKAFLRDNPAWPDRGTLTQRYEEALFIQGGSSRAIRDAFADAEPRTGAGFAALASAYLAEGNEARARELASLAWREHSLAASLEAGFLDRFGALLTEADHKWRFDRLMIDELRWASERAARAAAAGRVIPLLGKEQQRKAEARLAVFQDSKRAPKLMASLPNESAADWGLAFQRIQLLRRQGKHEAAWKILLSAPTDPAQIVSPDGWWIQRRAAAYGALLAGKPKLAFDLVREAGPLSANPRNDQTFMAGWIALRHLKDAKLAEPFFRANEKGSDGPLSRSRALFWLARTYEALGDQAKTREQFLAAAQYGDTFHGQLARERTGAAEAAAGIAPPQEPNREEIDRFNATDAVRAAVIAAKAGLDRGLVRAFLSQLQRTFTSEAEVAMVAHLAEALGDTQMAVRIGKAAIARGLNLVHYAYPIHAFPAYQPLRNPPEPALLLGIARQESEFNASIMSGAGARGILQVMPITARHVCRDYKIKCDIGRLMRDPAYNAMLASAYIGDRMSDVDGSYILTLTSYNAGPGRTRQWLRQFGDPREAGTDPLDWIFHIPFEETRDYVQKVLSNVQIYRARLGQADGHTISADLLRARRTPDSRKAAQ